MPSPSASCNILKEQPPMMKEPPPKWPPAVSEIYEPVRPLGAGGFGSVWMAKKREASDDPGEFVAMKLIGSGDKTSTKSEAAYARREVSILSELSHPCVVRLINSFTAHGVYVAGEESSTAPICVALSLARGPTVEQLLLHGGALGIHSARFVAVQLIDAVAFLHGRAVIHRDIKPDNCIVTGARLSDDAVYSDDADGEAAAKEGRWRLTLIDFGFARALHPSEMDVDIGLYKIVHDDEPNAKDLSKEGTNPAMLPSLDDPMGDTSRHQKRGRRNKDSSLDTSMSKKVVRDLSALGQRSYAAPEIMRGVRRFSGRESGKSGSVGGSKRRENELGISRHGKQGAMDLSQSGRFKSQGQGQEQKGPEPLAECVSDYGMVADAFSLGATIRYCLTGVPPNISVDEFLAMRNNPVAMAARGIAKLANIIVGRKSKKGGKSEVRKKRYKSNDKIPGEAAQLVRELTHWDFNKRTTVRAAKLFPWVADTLYEDEKPNTKEVKWQDPSLPGGKVHFLQCALDQAPPLGKEAPPRGERSTEERIWRRPQS